MKIKVTKDIIKNSTKASMNDCAVSNAMSKALERRVLVDYDVIKIDDKCFRPTPEVRKFVNDFDAGKRVKPIEFDTNDFTPTNFEIQGQGLRGRVREAKIRAASKSLFLAIIFAISAWLLIETLIRLL